MPELQVDYSVPDHFAQTFVVVTDERKWGSGQNLQEALRNVGLLTTTPEEFFSIELSCYVPPDPGHRGHSAQEILENSFASWTDDCGDAWLDRPSDRVSVLLVIAEHALWSGCEVNDAYDAVHLEPTAEAREKYTSQELDELQRHATARFVWESGVLYPSRS